MGSTAPVLAGTREPCTRPDRRSPGATTAPEGENHIKVQASLGYKRNVIRAKTYPFDIPYVTGWNGLHHFWSNVQKNERSCRCTTVLKMRGGDPVT